MNKQELQNEINKTKEHLANMEKMLAECEYERWKPTKSSIYYAVTEFNNVENIQYWQDDLDKDRYNTYNCFQTREQAEVEAEKILVRRMLEDIARRLNKGKEIDWFDDAQYKFCITEHFTKYSPQSLELQGMQAIKNEGTVYCLSEDFLDVAIQEIGEERLKKYLRGE